MFNQFKFSIITFIICTVLLFGCFFYFTLGHPGHFLNALQVALHPKYRAIVSVKSIGWIKLNNPGQLKSLKPPIIDSSNSPHYLLIFEGIEDVWENSGHKASRRPPQRTYDAIYVLVGDDGPPLAWSMKQPFYSKLATLGPVRTISFPFGN